MKFKTDHQMLWILGGVIIGLVIASLIGFILARRAKSEERKAAIDGLLADRSIWSNRHFLLLWLAQAISQTAQNAIWYGIVVLVQRLSHSSTQLSLAVLTLIIPSVIFGVLAGVREGSLGDHRAVDAPAERHRRAAVALQYF